VGVEYHLLGWPGDGPRLALDHEQFAYAGNFRTGRTGIAVALADGTAPPDPGASGSPTGELEGVVAAASFDADRAATNALRIRYVTVREDRRGEGIGPRLLAFVVDRAREREFEGARERRFERVRIGVNNPIAYRACYKAGFAFTGEESGMGELVLEAPAAGDRPGATYREGLARFADRDLPDGHRGVLERHAEGSPPDPVASPASR